MTRRPNAAEQRRERAVLRASLADAAMTGAFIAVALASGSLTLLGEAARAVLLLALNFYALWILVGLHRDRFAAFEFGVAKIEHLVWLLLGGGFLIGAYWVTDRVFTLLASGAEPASPQGLALAAIVNAVGLVINVMGWTAMRAAAGKEASEAYDAQVDARFAMIIASLILQATLTAAALAGDPGVALALDVAGALILVYFKLLRGVRMLLRGVPVLLDAPAEAQTRAGLRAAVAEVLPKGAAPRLRSRNAGRRTFAEVALDGGAFASTAEIAARAEALRTAVGARGGDVELRVVLAPSVAAPPAACGDGGVAE